MKFGVSTSCFYPEPLEDSVGKVISLEVPVTELFLNTFSEAAPAFITPLARALRSAGTEVRSLHPFTSGYEHFLLFSAYERRFRDSVEFYKRHFFETAALLGAEFVVLHGDRLYGKIETARYCERFSVLDRAAREFGVRLVQENVLLYRSEKAEFIREMCEILGDGVLFTLDIKQCVRAGESVFDMLEAMGPNLAHVHVSDHRPGADCLAVGQGSFDFHLFFRELKRRNYRGACILELYKEGYASVADLADSVRRMREITAELEEPS